MTEAEEATLTKAAHFVEQARTRAQQAERECDALRATLERLEEERNAVQQYACALEVELCHRERLLSRVYPGWEPQTRTGVRNEALVNRCGEEVRGEE